MRIAGVEVEFRISLTSTLNVAQWSGLRSDRFNFHGKSRGWTVGWPSPKVSLDLMANRKTLSLCVESTPGSSARIFPAPIPINRHLTVSSKHKIFGQPWLNKLIAFLLHKDPIHLCSCPIRTMISYSQFIQEFYQKLRFNIPWVFKFRSNVCITTGTGMNCCYHSLKDYENGWPLTLQWCRTLSIVWVIFYIHKVPVTSATDWLLSQ